MSTNNKKRRNLTMFVQSIEFHPKEFGLEEHITEIDIELNERQIIQLREALQEGAALASVSAFRIRLKGRLIL